MNFPFNQPEKTRDCGYRCLYYAVRPKAAYKDWLRLFRFFSPVKSGITFTDIHTVLDYYKIDYKFTQLTEHGMYIVYSGVWLKPDGKQHGHYLVYHDGVVYCSTKNKPEPMPLTAVLPRLEAKTIDGAFRCLEILTKGELI